MRPTYKRALVELERGLKEADRLARELLRRHGLDLVDDENLNGAGPRIHEELPVL